MNDDEVRILLYLYVNEASTTTAIAKDLFSSDTVKDLRNTDRRVRYYLDKWVKEGAVGVEKVNGKKFFSLTDKVRIGPASILMVSGEEEISVGLGNILMVLVPDGVHIELLPEEGC